MHHLSSGTLLQGGRYEIKRFIAAGGFGCTYEGVHTGLDKRVAIKEFFVKDFCNRDETTSQITVGVTAKSALFQKLRRKFEEEARALAKLNHPSIVKVSDVFNENGTSYYVMDYIDGPSLKNIVDTKGPLTETDAVRYILQVADALEYVHKNNRLHLDVKPGNIMINAEGKAQLIDFGASKQYEEESGENTSTVAGFTVGYAPTEQMGNDIKTFTPATDVYSLGATLYNILSGIKPISAATISSGEKQKPLPPHISMVTRNAIEKAMQINKNLRPQSMAEFKELFEASDDTVLPEKDNDDTVYAGMVEKPTEKSSKKGSNSSSSSNESSSRAKISEPKQEPKPEPQPTPKPKTEQKTSSKKIPWIAIAVVVCVIGFIAWLSSGTEEPVPSDNETPKVEQKQVEHVAGQTFKDAGGQDYTYTGEVVDGKPNGKGTGLYEYGTYTGEYKNGLREGKDGTFESKNGSNKYKGSFKNDQYEKGKLTLTADGSYFEGTFSKGQPYNGKWYNKDGSFNSDVVNGE
ncbi:MAG: protein kinase [Bacteroidaceae bacterium]|nr:protein kinase [Bacteroidaceae bacterium]